MPTKVFNTFGLRWTLNTGPFTIKEHTVITVGLFQIPSRALVISLIRPRLWQSKNFIKYYWITTNSFNLSVSIGYAYCTDALLALKAKRKVRCHPS